jgi:hypothetical protein
VVAFATIDDLMVYQQLTSVDTATAQQSLDLASAAIRAVCGWHIYPSQSDTATLDTELWSSDLFLPSRFVTAVGSVTEDGALVPAASYAWSPSGRIYRQFIRWGGRRPWLPGRVVVAFTHGYATVPDAVKAVCLGWASVGLLNPGALRSETVGSVSQTWAVAGPRDVVQGPDARLTPYTLMGV